MLVIPGPSSMTFDANGNLWVSVTFSDKVLKYHANQLSPSGSPNPTIEINTPGTPSATSIFEPQRLPLWVYY